MGWLLAGRAIESVLVSRLRYLGDVAMSTVVCEALRAGDPQLRIGFLCEAAHGVVLAGQPHLDDVHLLETSRRGADARARVRQQPDTTGAAASLGAPCGTWKMIGELRRAKYDLAVDLFFNPRSAWLLRLAGIPLRIGGTLAWRRRLYTHTVRRKDLQNVPAGFDAAAPGGLGQHLSRLAPLTHAETGLDFLTWLARHFAERPLRPKLVAPPVAPRDPGAPGGRRGLVLAPGATWASKQWPSRHWHRLVEMLAAADEPLRILVPPGRESEWAGLGEGYASSQVVVLPPLALPAVMAELAQARGLISVDGGVMHLGVALGTPTLGLFGPTDPTIWFPYAQQGPFRVLALAPFCHPCSRHTCDAFICLPDLSAEAVAAAAADLFGPSELPSSEGSA